MESADWAMKLPGEQADPLMMFHLSARESDRPLPDAG
jgi:hypothetical protein